MKKIACVICLLIVSNTLFGQHSINCGLSVWSQKNVKLNSLIGNVFRRHQRSSAKADASRTTSVKERLLAQSEYTHAVIPLGTVILDTSIVIDSAKYGYSGSRSSYFDYNFMNYYNGYVLDGSIIFGFGSSLGYLDHNDNPSMLSDTSEIYNIYPFTDSLSLLDTRYAIYDTGNNIVNYADVYPDSGVYSNNRYVNTFDAYQNISTSMALSETLLFSWDTSEFRSFFYDMAHHLILDSTNSYNAGSWSPLEKWTYTYDDSGNLSQANYYYFDIISSSWLTSIKYVLNYYSDNNLRTVGEYADSSYGWVSMVFDSFNYTTGVPYATYISENSYIDSGILDTRIIITKHVSIAGLPDTVFSTQYDASGDYISRNFTTYAYDSYDEPTISLDYQFIFDSTMVTGFYDSTYDLVNYYYYELYTESPLHPNSVANTTSIPQSIKVYPNPATNELNITRQGITNGAYTFIKILNAAGQTVRTESLPWYSETESISTASLVPGIYWLVIQDKNGNNLLRQSIVKQ